MTRAAAALGAALFLGCGNLPTTSEGVAFLRVEQPASPSILIGETLQLHAVALDKDGAPLEVPILWRTPDQTITLDAATGLVTAVEAGPARVQAVVGTEELVSDFLLLQVTEPPAPARRP